MPRKTLLLAAPAVVGALLLVWAIRSEREEPVPPAAKAPRPRAGAASTTSAADPLLPADDVAARPAERSSGAPGDVAIRARVAELERRLATLQAQKEALELENLDLETQISDRQAQARAEATAQWRVRSWEQLLGLSEDQKRSLRELATAWAKEDARRRASPDDWAARESELRARLSSEQASRLSRQTLQNGSQQWRSMGHTIASLAGLPPAEYGRIQQALGDFRAPPNALLPEAHGLDWPGLSREAAARARPLLSSEQAGRLDRHLSRY